MSSPSPNLPRLLYPLLFALLVFVIPWFVGAIGSGCCLAFDPGSDEAESDLRSHPERGQRTPNDTPLVELFRLHRADCDRLRELQHQGTTPTADAERARLLSTLSADRVSAGTSLYDCEIWLSSSRTDQYSRSQSFVFCPGGVAPPDQLPTGNKRTEERFTKLGGGGWFLRYRID